MRLGMEEWERWATWGGVKCGAVTSALLRQSRDVAEAIIGDVLFSPMRFVGRQSTEPWTFAVFAALSPLIDTKPDVGGFCSDFTTGNEDKMVAFSHFLRF